MFAQQNTAPPGGAAPVALTLSDPTFGDWLRCGDLQRQTIMNPREAGGDVAIEFTVSRTAVASWFKRLSNLTEAQLGALSMAEMRRGYADLVRKVPQFDQLPDEQAEMRTGGIPIKLEQRLPGHRADIEIVTIREPTFADWQACGDIYVTRALEPQAGGDLQPRAIEAKLDEKAVGRWFEALTGLPLPILSAMTYEDARRVFAVMKPHIKGFDAGN